MSNIIFNNIDVTFPIAGQDNPSKGFRDNWSYIQTALSTAKSEITALETTTVLTSNLTNGEPAENDLNQSIISNGSYKEFYGTSTTITPASSDSTISINVANGDAQQINLDHTSVTVVFSGWPDSPQYAKVRLHISNTAASSVTITNITSNSALSIKKDNLFPAPFAIPTGKYGIIEVWSFNGGNTVFVKYLGEY